MAANAKAVSFGVGGKARSSSSLGRSVPFLETRLSLRAPGRDGGGGGGRGGGEGHTFD